MSETIHLKAEHIGATASKNNLRIVATMSVEQMADAVRSIAAVMPGDSWRELMAEINGGEQPCTTPACP